MLALNCVCPATSTLVTLLVHTSRGRSVVSYNPLTVMEKFRSAHMFTSAHLYIASIEVAQRDEYLRQSSLWNSAGSKDRIKAKERTGGT